MGGSPLRPNLFAIPLVGTTTRTLQTPRYFHYMLSMDLPSPLMILAGLVFSIAIWRVSSVGRRAEALPPGPPTSPLLGNLHQFPKEYAYRQ